MGAKISLNKVALCGNVKLNLLIKEDHLHIIDKLAMKVVFLTICYATECFNYDY